MENFAVHMRISNIVVSDDDVASRRAAAVSLASKWKKESKVSSIISKAVDVAEAIGGDGRPSSSLGNEVQAVIQKKAPAYLYEERPLDVGVCSGMAMASILKEPRGEGDWLITDVYATALWSALSYQPPLEEKKRESLRCEVLEAAASRSAHAAERSRVRIEVQDSLEVKITVDQNGKASSNFNDAVGSTVNALRRNAALDREELDFLWWALLGRSRLLGRQLSTIAEPTRILACGIEGAKVLRRLPCEVHREIVLRTLDQDPELDLRELLTAIGDDRMVLVAEFVEGSAIACPTIFPLLHALVTGEAVQAGCSIKRRVSEWGARALLESAFAKMISQGAKNL